MKTFTAPEGKLVTVLVDGVEVSYVPGQEYPDNAEFVVTERLAEQPASFDRRGIEPYRAAVMVNETRRTPSRAQSSAAPSPASASTAQ